MKDFKNMNSDEILEILKSENELYMFPDIGNPTLPEAVGSYIDTIDNEYKLHQALSTGIVKNSNIKASDNYLKTLEKLAEEMEVDRPNLKIDYGAKGLAAYADPNTRTIGINPELLDPSMREAIMSHELRHLKELKPGETIGLDTSPRNVLWTKPTNPSQSLYNAFAMEDEMKRMEGRALSEFMPKDQRLFEGDKLNYRTPVLDKYDYLERGHFKTPFLSTNLKRAAKGLPLVGTALAILADPSNADAEILGEAIPGGIQVMGSDPSIEDPQSPEFRKRQILKEMSKTPR